MSGSLETSNHRILISVGQHLIKTVATFISVLLKSLSFPVFTHPIFQSFAMSPKRQVKETKKLTLKKESPPVQLDLQEAGVILKMALEANTAKNLSFDNILGNCSLETLKKMDIYVRHNKTNVSKKLETIGSYTNDVSQMLKLRQFLDENIQKSTDLIHDSIIEGCGGSCEDFDIEILKSKISVKIGELSAKEMKE